MEGKEGGSVPDSLGDYVEVVLGVVSVWGVEGEGWGMGDGELPLGLGVLRSCIGLWLRGV